MTRKSSELYIHGGLMYWRRFYTIFKMVWGIQQSLLARSHQKAGVLFGTVVIFLLWRSGKVQKVPEFESFLYSESWICLYILSFSRLKPINHHQPLWRCTEPTKLGATSLAFDPQWPRSLKASSDPALYPVLWVARVPPFSDVVTAVSITTERKNDGLNLGGPTISGQCC